MFPSTSDIDAEEALFVLKLGAATAPCAAQDEITVCPFTFTTKPSSLRDLKVKLPVAGANK